LSFNLPGAGSGSFVLAKDKGTTKAVMDSLLEHVPGVESLAVLSWFRVDFYACLTAR
jgi:hypothetical protein